MTPLMWVWDVVLRSGYVDPNASFSRFRTLCNRAKAALLVAVFGFEYQDDYTDGVEIAIFNWEPRYESSFFHRCGDWDVLVLDGSRVYAYRTGCC